LRMAVFQNLDFEIVSVEIWELFHRWYGGGPKIVRHAVRMLSGEVQIEVHLLNLRACKVTDHANIVTCDMSRTATIGALKFRLCSSLGLDSGKVRVLNLGDEDDTLDCRVIQDQLILLDEQQLDGRWGAEEAEQLPKSTEATSEEVLLSTQTAGLENLGNTCFMNSSLQCLANIPQLRDYFRSGAFRPSLKVYGQVTEATGGRVAQSFSKLLDALWEQDAEAVKPSDFSQLIGKVAERFTGNRQHDSMEFIEFLIDSLKEDCNMVKGRKLYVESADSNGREDTVVALEAGSKFLLRCDSAIDDLFVGFFRSALTCPEEECCFQSVAFDPFLSVKLPIMSAERSRLRSFQVDVVPLSSSGWSLQRHSVTVEKFGSINILVDAVATAAGIVPENCVLVEIFKAKVYKFFEDADRLEDISSGDELLLYELKDAPSFNKPAVKRWGVGSDVKVGDLVVVKSAFVSNSKTGVFIEEDVYGKVSNVDDDGDAYIAFDDPGLDDPQWVFKRNLSNIIVDLEFDSDKEKLDPDDGQVYTLRAMIEMYAGDAWKLKDLRVYWTDSMDDLPGAEPSLPEVVYLPMELNGKTILVNEGEDRWKVTNCFFNASSSCVAYRKSKTVDDTLNDGPDWESRIKAVDEGDGWVRIQSNAEVELKTCGVVVSFRRVVPDEKPEFFALPVFFCTQREAPTDMALAPEDLPPNFRTSAMIEEVATELKRRGLPHRLDQWTIYRVHVNDVFNTESLLEEETDASDEEIRRGERQHIILEWEGEAPVGKAEIVNQGDAAEDEEEDVSLEMCFKWMTDLEQLSEQDCVFCQGCKELQPSFKKVDLWSAPPVMVLQLKRFEFTGVERQRVNTKVRFPLEGLDLTEFCLSDTSPFPKGDCLRAGQRVEIHGMVSSIGQKLNGSQGIIEYIDSGTGTARWSVQLDDAPEVLTLVAPENLKPIKGKDSESSQATASVFDLVAVSKHIGGAKFGHYVAYARSCQSGVWHLFDDGDVTEVLPQEVSDDQEGAYILFYLRRDCRPESWGKAVIGERR